MIKKTLCFSNPAYLSLMGILCITDKQFGEIEIFHAAKPKKIPTPCQQLELF